MDDRAHQLAQLALELAQAASEADTAAAVIDRARTYVADADAVSITVRARRHRYVTLAATGDLPRHLDQLQYTLREGPCIGVADGSDWFRSGDLGHDERWPAWGPHARSEGINSLLSVALLLDGAPTGALNFYAHAVGAFSTRDDVDAATLYATHAAIALTSTRQVAGLESAVQSRHVIGMAQGILMQRFGLDRERSFQLLQRYSNTANTKLATIAEEIVRTGEMPSLPHTE
jgi:GAF domain-containing protein